jgi:hypothetical protein
MSGATVLVDLPVDRFRRCCVICGDDVLEEPQQQKLFCPNCFAGLAILFAEEAAE